MGRFGLPHRPKSCPGGTMHRPMALSVRTAPVFSFSVGEPSPMVKPEWGTKRTCPKCATRFYDLGKDDPIHCINCGVAWQAEPVLKSKQPLPFEAAKVEVEAEKEDADLAADAQPIGYYLARGDAARGEAYFSRCTACHSIAPGAPPSIGPNLYGVMGHAIASRPDAVYSAALRDHGGTWDWDTASRFLQLPRAFAPGTPMTFVGVANPQDRAHVMLCLNRQGGS